MKDYKLSEIKKICEKYSTDYDRFCEKCPLGNGVCGEIENAPATWEIDEKEKENAELQKQVDKLKEQFLLTCENCHLKKDIELLKYQKEQAVKEFAEKVKMAFYYEFDEIIPSIMSDKIDELLKEYEK